MKNYTLGRASRRRIGWSLSLFDSYVVQTAIDVVPEGREKQMLLQELKANEVQLVSGARLFDCFISVQPLDTLAE